MYWKTYSPSATQIEALLEKEDVTLLQLMAEDELLQECQAQNKKVVDFLTKPEILEELVELIVTEPPAINDISVRFKNANLASELLSCDATSITSKLATSSNLLQLLFQFLQSEKPLNPLLASFVAKVLGKLVLRNSAQDWYSYQFTCFQVIDFLKSKENFVTVVVHHVGTSAVLDLISNLINGVDSDEKALKTIIHQWLDECQLIQKLVDMLLPENDSSEHASVDQVLCGIIDSKWSEPNNSDSSQIMGNILLTRLESDEVVSRLLDILLHEDRSNSSVSHVINVLIALLATRNPKSSLISQAAYEEDSSSDIIDNSQVVNTICNRLEQLKSLLTTPTKGLLPTSYGEEVEVLGTIRLYTCKLLTALVKTNYKQVHIKLAEMGTLKILMEMFFKFSLNNLLHDQVAQFLLSILENPVRDMEKSSTEESSTESNSESIAPAFESPLLKQLFDECEFVQNLLAAFSPDAVPKEPKAHNKRAYMGHLREISNAIVTAMEKGPNAQYLCKLMEALSKNVQQDWQDFKAVGLAEVNLRNLIVPIQSFFQDFRGSAMDAINDDLRRVGLDEASGKDFNDDSADFEPFEQMFAQRRMDEATNDEFWNWVSTKQTATSGDKENNSSSDEDDDEFDNLRSIDEKMEDDRKIEHKQDMFLDITEWSGVFDKRDKGTTETFNPWQTAPVEDTSDNTWASFDSTNSTKGAGSNFYSSTGFEVNFENAFKQSDQPHIFEMKCSEAPPQDISSPFQGNTEEAMSVDQKPDSLPQPMDSQDSESIEPKTDLPEEVMTAEPTKPLQECPMNDGSSLYKPN